METSHLRRQSHCETSISHLSLKSGPLLTPMLKLSVFMQWYLSSRLDW